MKNDIERILEDYEIDDPDGLRNDLEDYLRDYVKSQLEDAYNDVKNDIDNSLWDLEH